MPGYLSYYKDKPRLEYFFVTPLNPAFSRSSALIRRLLGFSNGSSPIFRTRDEEDLDLVIFLLLLFLLLLVF